MINLNKKVKKTLLIVSCVLIVVFAVAGVFINKSLDKIKSEDETTAYSVNSSKAKIDNEEINFKDYEVITTDISVLNQEDNEELTTSVVQNAISSENLEAIYKIEDGETVKVSGSKQELIEEAAKIQEAADSDIKENVENHGDVWYSDDVYNLLIIGYDAGDDEVVMFEGMKYPRSDCIIIASINKKQKTIKLVSLSRATYVAIKDHGNKRINTAHAYGGAQTLISTIESNYKVRIDNYVSVDFAGFQKIIDALNGVTIKLTATEASFAFDKPDMPESTYILNGKQALRYVRFRKADSDRARTGRQRKVLRSVYQKAKSMSLDEELSFVDTVFPYLTTDLSKGEIVSNISHSKTYLNYNLTEDIIPHNAVKLQMRDGKEVLILDWNETVEYLHSILYSGVKVSMTEPRE